MAEVGKRRSRGSPRLTRGVSSPRVLVIGGWDPTGGAGVARDMSTARALEVEPAGVLSAVVPQDGARVQRVIPVDVEVVREQIESAVALTQIDVWKVGLLPTAEHVHAVREAHARAGSPPLVHDPVVWSGDGHELTADSALGELRGLLRRARVSTPNYKEAVTLGGREVGPAQLARDLAPVEGWCVVTGGDTRTRKVIDWASNGSEIVSFVRRRVDAGWVRGTGCAMSSALACLLAHGAELPAAIGSAGDWLADRMRETVRGTDGAGGRLP